MPDLYLTGDPAADALLSTDPLALLLGMLLDQKGANSNWSPVAGSG